MPNVCYFTGKRTRFGRKVARRGKAKYLGGVGKKVTGITSRKFRPNLQRVRAIVEGRVVRIKVSVKAIRQGLVEKPHKRLFKGNVQPEQLTSWRNMAGLSLITDEKDTIPDSSVAIAEVARFFRPRPGSDTSGGGKEIAYPTSWGDWLTFRKFASRLAGLSGSGASLGADVAVTKLAFFKTENKKRVAPGNDRDDVNSTVTDESPFRCLDGVVFVRDRLPSKQELSDLTKLRSAYVELSRADKKGSLDLAAQLVDLMRSMLPTAMYPVVLGPIKEDEDFELADSAYHHSVRITTRNYEDYLKNEGRLRGPAARLR